MPSACCRRVLCQLLVDSCHASYRLRWVSQPAVFAARREIGVEVIYWTMVADRAQLPISSARTLHHRSDTRRKRLATADRLSPVHALAVVRIVATNVLKFSGRQRLGPIPADRPPNLRYRHHHCDYRHWLNLKESLPDQIGPRSLSSPRTQSFPGKISASHSRCRYRPSWRLQRR